MRATLNDPELQAAFERDGYVKFPLLTPDEVQALRRHFEEIGPAPGDPHLACHSSFHSYDIDYKKRINAAIKGVIGSHLPEVFDHQRDLPSNYIVKWPAATSGFGLHQDLSLVDERHHRSAELWIALDDTTPQNGQLWMVPGSHEWLPGRIRGINGFDFPFDAVAHRIIERHARPEPLLAGEAIVFNHAVLHFSFPNRTDEPRRVAIADLIPEEAQHLHYFGDDAGGIDVYEIDDSFWTDNSPFTLWRPPPATSKVGKASQPAISIDDEFLDAMVAEGRAIDTTSGARGAINAAGAWCHRCGSTDVAGTAPDRWIGNVTLLCEPCRQAEAAHSATPSHVAPSTV